MQADIGLASGQNLSHSNILPLFFDKIKGRVIGGGTNIFESKVNDFSTDISTQNMRQINRNSRITYAGDMINSVDVAGIIAN